MASSPLIAIVCSDRHRNGKTMLARVLVDFLLLEGRDPYCLDLSHPEGALRAFFPGRTALVDFAQVSGQMKVFDTILAGPGRDYVIDLPAQELARFCEVMGGLEPAAPHGHRIDGPHRASPRARAQPHGHCRRRAAGARRPAPGRRPPAPRPRRCVAR